jgi:hypothetical protein
MTQDHILRKDTRGRVVVTAQRRAGLLEQFDQSGTSGIQFARLAGVKYSTFAYWLQQRRKKRNAPPVTESMEPRGEPGPKVHWLEAVVAGEKESPPLTRKTGPLVMHGPAGVWWEVNDLAQAKVAAAVLREMGRAC